MLKKNLFLLLFTLIIFSGKSLSKTEGEYNLLSVEDFIIYQVYQETKCHSWQHRNGFPVTCTTQPPKREKNKIKFYLRTTFPADQKEEQNVFLSQSPERKESIIFNQSKYLMNEFLELIDREIYIPDSLKNNSIAHISKIKKNIHLEIMFSYGPRHNYKVSLKPNFDPIIKKLTFYPDNLHQKNS